MPTGLRSARRSAEPFDFLIDQLVDSDTLAMAAQRAERLRLPLQVVLISEELVSADAYVARLAQHLGVVALPDIDASPDRDSSGRCTFLDGESASPESVRFEIATSRASYDDVVLLTRAAKQRLDDARAKNVSLQRAVSRLQEQNPTLSAGTPIWSWQIIAATSVAGLVAGGALVLPGPTITLISLLIALPFVWAVLFRLLALITCVVFPGSRASTHDTTKELTRGTLRTPDEHLPIYSVLVPLHGEAAVLPGLIRALSRLDYPAAKLEVLLVLEAADLETRRAAAALALPAFFRTIVVPDAAPRTKPKALNYAISQARGAYVAVYDAEDEPDPQQLRRALAIFDVSGESCWCVQAKLGIHNARASWLTQQFALEYTTLFDALLPAVARLGVPVPLGGTSNHFRRDALDRLGGWDPYNVTEDIDLGVRLARAGGTVAIADSITWEEAPVRFVPWLKQRTRWIKGWMQTYLVHTREPMRLTRELGIWGCLGFHALVGGLILSALVHPVFYVAASVDLIHTGLLVEPRSPIEKALWAMAAFNLLAGYFATTLLAATAILRRGRLGLGAHVLLMPLYWLLISLAAYRALFQLLTDPHRWEKTEHHGRVRSRMA